MKSSLKSIIALVCICAAVSILLSLTNLLTAPIIEANQNAAANEALLEVLPEGKNFALLDTSQYTLPSSITEVYGESGGGYVFKITTSGYSSGLVIMCGVRADGTVSGAVCLSSGETLGYEKTYGDSFIGVNMENVGSVDTVSGATKTTTAYRSAIKDALSAAVILGGGDVDLRSEEEIFADNLASALPEGEGSFTKLFIVEDIEGIDAVYTADNRSGAVCVVGERFIAVYADGRVVGDAPDDVLANVGTQMEKINASVTEEVDIGAYEGLSSAILAVLKTESGNYVIDVRAAGYGINGGDDYHPASGEYIYIKVSLTADGRIIDCLTVSQAETENIGSACADKSFYGQFVGKTEDNYDSIDAITGATYTTNGYKKAILRAFEAVKIMEGGAMNEE